MAKLSDDKKYIIIGIPGLYKISTHLSWPSSNCNAGDYADIRVNDRTVIRTYGSPSGYGTFERIMNLKKGDKIGFYINWVAKGYNTFTIQKL